MNVDKKKILVIDDETTFTRMLRLNLEKTGEYEVREEKHGRKGPAAAREFKPDLIFLDVIMPDVDGGEVASLIQADPNLKHIPIVFLTATVSRKEVGSGGTKRGGLFFLAKPVTTEQLLECIDKHLKKPEAKTPPPSEDNPPIAAGS
jgi:CheY-like chemotaxis protein